MGRTTKAGADFLRHYASEFYDPAKAHEYYLKNRDLKGRRSASNLKGDKKKEAWSYAEEQINAKKKGDIDQAGTDRKAVIERARQIASDRRKALGEKLSDLLGSITESRTADAKKLSEEADEKIAALPLIPKGISKEQRAELAAKRAEEIAKIRGETFQKRQSLSADTKSTKAKGKGDVTDEREAVSSELKTAVDKARADYQTLKESLKAKYEERAQREFESIRQKV